MVDRYIYAVTKELSEKSRKEIGIELKALIEDMMGDTDSTLNEEEKINKVLRDLGNPKELANRYRGRERYLIGPLYFDKYLFVMKIVVLSIVIGISAASGFGVIFSIKSITQMIGGYISALFSAVLQGAAWVTGIFALLEYKQAFTESTAEEKTWTPSQLPALPDKKARISRGESIFSIIISTVFLQLFFFSPEIIGIYYATEGTGFGFIPLFNIIPLSTFRTVIMIIFTLNILSELIKIIKGRWTLSLAVITSVLGILSSALFIYMISNRTIWNQDVMQKIESYLPIDFERMVLLTIAIIILVTLAESAAALYKGIRYGGNNSAI